MTRDTSAEPTRVVFGRYLFDRTSGALSRDGITLELLQSASTLLDRLLTQPGQLVTYRDLAGPAFREGSTAAPAGVRTAIKELRQVLRDPADYPMYIETVRGIGYRFIAPVTAGDHQESPTPGPAQQLATSLEGTTPRTHGASSQALQSIHAPAEAPMPNLIRWINDDRASMDFSVIWTATTIPLIALLVGWPWVPLALLPPMLRLAFRWLVYRRMTKDGVDPVHVARAVEWADAKVESARPGSLWRVGARRIARLALWTGASACGTFMLSAPFHPWRWSPAMQEAWNVGFMPAARLVLLCVLIVIAEAIINPRPFLEGTRHRCLALWRSSLRHRSPASPPLASSG